MIDYISLTSVDRLSGALKASGDKSISHRALILSAITNSIIELDNINTGLDVKRTKDALRLLGVSVKGNVVYGSGLHGLKKADIPIYMGNSGTSMRLLMGLLAGQEFSSVLTGDESLERRPMQRVADPLIKMGAIISLKEGCAPVTISPSKLVPIKYKLPVASAQVKSALQIASLYTGASSELQSPSVMRNHTDLMLKYFLEYMGDFGHNQKKKSFIFKIPGDISSAAFPIVAAIITPGSDITIDNVGLNVTRIGFLKLLTKMGADIQYEVDGISGYEVYGKVRVRYSQLFGINIENHWIPNIIDELPILFIAAACAKGDTIVKGAAELRVKETDRLSVMANGLASMGVAVEEYADGIKISGATHLKSCQLSAQGDHRIAMAFLIASLKTEEGIKVTDCENIKTSYPSFFQDIQSIGAKLNNREEVNV